MLLDQQVPMEWAFKGPHTLKERLSGTLDPATIAAMDPEQVEALFKDKPAIHRFPGSMAKRTHAVAQFVTDNYDGDTAAIWATAADGQQLYDRLRELPGYGDEKAKIFMAILGKRMGVTPTGWEVVAAPFSDDTPRSVADIDSDEAFQRVRAFKKEMKAKGKQKDD
jgi:uncharacterized HhH-GPD family protein